MPEVGLTCDDSVRIVREAMSFEMPNRLPVFEGSFWSGFVEASTEQAVRERTVQDKYPSDLAVCVAREEFFPTRVREIARRGSDLLRDDGWGRLIRTKSDAFFVEPVERLLDDPRKLDAIEFDPPELDMRYTAFAADVVQQREAGKPVFVKIGGPFIRSTFIRGEAELLTDLLRDPGFARALVEKVAGHLLRIALESLRRADAYDFGVWIYDDMCSLNGPVFSPATFEEVFLPLYCQMVSALKGAGARWVVLHCDGCLEPLLDMVIDAGIDGINPVEPRAGMDVVKLMDRFYGRLRLIGGVCNAVVLPEGDPKRIREHLVPMIEAGRHGGLIIGTHSIGPDVSIDAYDCYRRIVAKEGAYAARQAEAATRQSPL
jgi:uroporphyrinogen decarboxylase